MSKIRKQFIKDVVESYIKKYPDEYESFLRQHIYRKAIMNDKNFGIVKGEKSGELRVGLSMPQRIHDTFAYVLKGEEKPFGEEKGEMKWFAKKFPQFLLPNNY